MAALSREPVVPNTYFACVARSFDPGTLAGGIHVHGLPLPYDCTARHYYLCREPRPGRTKAKLSNQHDAITLDSAMNGSCWVMYLACRWGYKPTQWFKMSQVVGDTPSRQRRRLPPPPPPPTPPPPQKRGICQPVLLKKQIT